VAVQVASRLGDEPATRDLVDALVLVTPFDSVRSVVRHHARGFPLDVLLGDHFRSDLHVGAVTAPVTVVRAGRDVVVPPSSTDRLVRLLPPGARVVDLPERDHADVIAADETWDAIARAVEGVDRT
jgi:pimeloyl-ACP methyl ester carboxylesterase